MIRLVSILIIIGHLTTEIPVIWESIDPSINEVRLKPFINYTWYEPEGIYAVWFMKYAADDVLWVMYCISFCIISYRINRRLFLVACAWLLYHILDGFMYYYNFKTFHWWHWSLYAVVVFNVIMIISRPIKLKPI